MAGALTAYYVLWRVHALVPGHPLARRTTEVMAPPSPTPRPIVLSPTAPTRTATPTPPRTP